MKKVLIFLLSFCAIISLIFLALFYFYEKRIKSNIEEYNNEIKQQWLDIYNLSGINKNSMKNILKNDSTIILKDSLYYFLSKDKDNQTAFQKECSLPYLQNEYNINRIYLKIIRSDSTFYSDSINDNINYRNIKINRSIDDYNKVVMGYNKYIIMIPNQLVAKRNNFKRKILYSIKYGGINENPMEESKKLPKWAEDVDTTKLYNN